MAEEKVMYVKLPDGAKYQRVEVTEDGKVGIVYTKECLSNKEIPKPIPLIGGTDVYQKDNGTPYWYCKIKEGRDEFMHLYFKDLTEQDLLFDDGKARIFTTMNQEKFMFNVLEALKNKPKEGYRWIPVFEPSVSDKNLQYVAGEKVLRMLYSDEWEQIFNEYSPTNGSQPASITTYFLLALRWLKDGTATLKQLADDSKEIGHYWDTENYKGDLEKTGEREFGGLFGFVGNTYKIVKDPASDSGFSYVGGHCGGFGNDMPLTNVKFVKYPNRNPYMKEKFGVGLLELTK